MIIEYLQSAKAREDVRGVLAKQNDVLRRRNSPYPGWTKTRIDAWDRLRFFCIAPIGDNQWVRQEATCYVRQEGERFIITDLGDGIRSLRLATGRPLAEHKNWIDNVCRSIAGQIFSFRDPGAAGLPESICDVLLASYRVAQLAQDPQFKGAA